MRYTVWKIQAMSSPELLDHWRRRLLELVSHLKTTEELNQGEIADQVELAPGYLSRLLSEPAKAGHKNLGIATMRKFQAVFGLTADWFDLPLGSALPGSAASAPKVPELSLWDVRHGGQSNLWPFPTVPYSRIASLKKMLGPARAREALLDISETLESSIIKWERKADGRSIAAL